MPHPASTHHTPANVPTTALEAAEAARAACAANSPDAALLDALAAALQALEDTQEEIDDAKEASLAAWERKNGPADAYRTFFYDCFDHLAAHYPCPSVTNDHDCSVIFAAIERGEEYTSDSKS